MVPLETWRFYNGKLSLNEIFFFVSRFQMTKGRMIALRRPPVKPLNRPRNPTSGQRPSPSKSVCWMDRTTRPRSRCAYALNTFPPDTPSSRDGCSMATGADLQPLLPPARVHERILKRTRAVLIVSMEAAPSPTRQELQARFTPQTQIWYLGIGGLEGVRCLVA